MISFGQVWAFGLVSLVIAAVPGPGALFLVGRALAYGRRIALASAVGDVAGSFVLAAAVAFGLGSLVERSVLVFTVVKLAGAAYLIFLGIQALWHQRDQVGLYRQDTSHTGTIGGKRAAFDGFLVGVANPKTLVFLAAVLPQFVNPSQGHVPLQMLVLGAVFCLIDLPACAVWSLAADTARTWLGRSPRRMALVGRAGGLAMISLGVSVAVAGRRD